MGSGQSKAEVDQEKIIVDQLQAMSVNKQRAVEDAFVHIGSEKEEVRESRPQGEMNLSTKDVFEWERQLLQDPKNR